jgi:hypothetical protein
MAPRGQILTQILQPLHRPLTCKVALKRNNAFCRQMATHAPQMPHTSGLIAIMKWTLAFPYETRLTASSSAAWENMFLNKLGNMLDSLIRFRKVRSANMPYVPHVRPDFQGQVDTRLTCAFVEAR